MSQQDNSRAAVERLVAELASTDDPAHAEALASQIRIHAELAGLATGGIVAGPALQFEDPPALVVPKQGRTPKTAEG